MATDTPRASVLLEQESRYVLAAPLCEGRRVLDLGGTSARALATLAEAGASEITVAAIDAESLARELEGLGIEGVEAVADAALPLPFGDAAFDFILCHDLTARLAADGAWLAELRRVLHPDGYVLFAVAREDGRRLCDLAREELGAPLSYEQAFEHLAPQFGRLTLFGQSPVVANLFYDLEAEDDEPGLTFDRSLLSEDAQEPGWYVMLFGPETQHRDDLNIVELPFGDVAERLLADGAVAAEPEPASDPAEHAQLQEALDRTLFELAAAQMALAQAQQGPTAGETADESATRDELNAAATALVAQLERERATLERALIAARDAEAVARGEAERLFGELRAMQDEQSQLHERLRAQQHEIDVRHQDGVDARGLLEQRTAELEARLAEAQTTSQAQVAQALGEVESRAAEVERQLSQRVAELDHALAQAQADAERVHAEAQATHAAQERGVVELTEIVVARDAELTQVTQELAALRQDRDAERRAWEEEHQAQQRKDAVAAELNDQYETVSVELSNARREAGEHRTRAAELEGETRRFQKDRESLEQQIADLLHEVTELREMSAAPVPAPETVVVTAPDPQQQAQIAELSRSLAAAHEQRAALERDLQQARDALHASPPSSIQEPAFPEPVRAGASRLVTRDAVGRKVETTLEEIEDLLANAVPTAPPGR